MEKSFLFIFLLFILIGHSNGQTESKSITSIKCTCGQWSGIEVVISGTPTTPGGNVKCGGEIQLPNVGTYQISTTDFICKPAKCEATYNWQVTGPVSGNGTGKPFSFFFSAPGTYTVIVTPICGNQKCEPCKFTVIIKPICSCGQWKGIEVVIGGTSGNPGANVKCGGQVTLNSGTYQIIPTDFICNPTSCPATYHWQVTGPVSGNGTGKPFSFNFSAPGTYTVLVTPLCNGQRCEPCKFIVIINTPTCSCGKWKGIEVMVGATPTTPGINVKCGGQIELGSIGNYQIITSEFICIPNNCLAIYKWQVFGPVNGNGIGRPFSFNFAAPGTYTVVVTPVCGSQQCEPCKFSVIVKKT